LLYDTKNFSSEMLTQAVQLLASQQYAFMTTFLGVIHAATVWFGLHNAQSVDQFDKKANSVLETLQSW
jgi:Na+/H+ antiporter NhaC